MGIGDCIALAIATVVWFLCCMIVTVLVHETGHLISGLISGYRLSGFAISGFIIRRQDGRLGWHRYSHQSLSWGQCFMYANEINAPPRLLIAGGCIMNIVIGVILSFIAIITISLEGSGVWRLMLLAVPASINIVMGIANLTGGSASSDGNTLKEVKSDEGRRMYNRVMKITAELLDGKMYSEMPASLFEYSGSSSLAEEIRMYGYYRKCEECKDNAGYRELISKFGFNGKPKGQFFLEEKQIESELASAVLSKTEESSLGKVPVDAREVLLMLARCDKNVDEVMARFEKDCPMPGLVKSVARCWGNIKEIRKERYRKNG